MKKKKSSIRLTVLITVTVLLLAGILAAVLASCTAVKEKEKPRRTEPTTEPIPSNEYLPEGFYTEDGFLHYRNQEHKIGIDVSAHQEVIDWKQVAEAGVEFAIIRAGYRGSTVGDLYEDEQFSYNLTEAKNVGIQVGVYFYSQALTPEEAEEEAIFLCKLLKDTELDLPVYYDWEFTDAESRIPSIEQVPLTRCTKAFCEIIRDHGYQPGVYFNQNFGYHRLNLRQLQDYHLWLAEYGEVPEFRYHFDCLQYSDSGTVPGIEVPVDLDILFIDDEKKSPAEPDSFFIF